VSGETGESTITFSLSKAMALIRCCGLRELDAFGTLVCDVDDIVKAFAWNKVEIGRRRVMERILDDRLFVSRRRIFIL
jgi:hypothetical protein